MSGTSVDAVDCVLTQIDGDRVELLATHSHPISASLRADIASLSRGSADEIERLGLLDRALGALFAEACQALLTNTGTPAKDVFAIGSHGQTLRHRPAGADRPGFTLQAGDPNTIAEQTGITTVADFRRRDIAAGGHGAPLAPAFHAAVMAKEDARCAIVNVGGIANVTLLDGRTIIAGFDTGPGNTLMDHWIGQQLGERYDNEGRWAASGTPDEGLLSRLLSDPFFSQPGPKSTGKEHFNLDWLKAHHPDNINPADIQATLLALTSSTIAMAIRNQNLRVDTVYLCGGGAHNRALLTALQEALDPMPVTTTAALGFDPDWVEAAAFAWLAARTLAQQPGNAPIVTGATGPRILGAIFAAGNQKST